MILDFDGTIIVEKSQVHGRSVFISFTKLCMYEITFDIYFVLAFIVKLKREHLLCGCYFLVLLRIKGAVCRI